MVKEAVGLSGGMLIIWNSDLLEAIFSFFGRGFVGVLVKWKSSNDTCFLVNVYSPCAFDDKKEVWRDLLLCKRSFGGVDWCVAGDFNAVTSVDERKGIGGTHNSREISGFNHFISEMDLVDIPVLGKRYTWFSGDGIAKSRLDRFLLTEDVITKWNVAAQWVGDRDISDHCPIWLDCAVYDWGPKPFRFNNCWIQHNEFKAFVAEYWKGFNVRGWKIYAFKEKLKLLREKLREWNKEVFDYLDLNIKNIVKDINVLDGLVETGNVQELERRKDFSSLFWQQVRAKENLIKQKARCKWIAEGDANTCYFHACVRGRRRRNQLLALKKEGGWIDGVGGN